MDFFTSDLHFGHKKLAIERGYADVDAMDRDMVERINAQATSYLDTIYIIGDMSFHKPAATAGILRGIIGRKVLVKGNHDNRTKNAMGATLATPVMEELEEFHLYLERNFKMWTVRGGEATFDDQRICMFHFPMMHWKDQHKGAWQLHGHLHGHPAGVPGKIMDVGWDAHNKLLTLEDIARHMTDRPLRLNHHEGVGTQ